MRGRWPVRARTRHVVSTDELKLLLTPRDDFVQERRVTESADLAGTHRYALTEGPFRHFDRTVVVEDRSDGSWDVEQDTTFATKIPIWGLLFTALVAIELRRVRRADDSMPWWSPPDRVDSTSAASLAYLSVLALVSGYLGSLLSQTVAFAGREFGADSSAQSNLAGWVRFGVPIALIAGIAADRLGRRRTILVAAVVACLLAAVTAATPTFWGYGVSQGIARGVSAGLAMLIGVAAAEETPDGSRAFITSLLTAAAGLGSGMVLWFVPLTELGDRAWRLLFLFPLVALPVIAWMWNRLPETRRFVRATSADVEAAPPPVGRSLLGLLRNRRFGMLALTALLLSIFAAPASTLQTTFLTTERGFDGNSVTLFKLVTGTPVGIGLVIAGKLADTRGRKVVGGVGLIAGVIFTAFEFTDTGWRIWMWGVLGTLLAAAVAPALGVYGPELFGTRSRSLSNAALLVVGTAGSAIGLFFAGWALDRWSFSTTFFVLAIAPITVALLLIFVYPETKDTSLEELNAEDAQLFSS